MRVFKQASSGPVTLRATAPADYDLALRLYLDGIRPYAAQLMAWDDAAQADRFARQWRGKTRRSS